MGEQRCLRIYLASTVRRKYPIRPYARGKILMGPADSRIVHNMFPMWLVSRKTWKVIFVHITLKRYAGMNGTALVLCQKNWPGKLLRILYEETDTISTEMEWFCLGQDFIIHKDVATWYSLIKYLYSLFLYGKQVHCITPVLISHSDGGSLRWQAQRKLQLTLWICHYQVKSFNGLAPGDQMLQDIGGKIVN